MSRLIFLSIRDKATRLPGKSFADVAGRAAVEQLVSRLLRSKRADGIVVCTSTHPDDRVFEPVAEKYGLACFRGSENDKLDRYLKAAERYQADFCVIVDGDDLLCDPAHIDRILDAYDASIHANRPLDYVIVDKLPLGATGFGVRIGALRLVCERKGERDTEVWGGYFANSPEFNTAQLEPVSADLCRPEIRLTLDYAEDLAVFRAIFERFGDTPFSLGDAIGFLDANPSIRDSNANSQEQYLAHLSRSASVLAIGSSSQQGDN